MARAALCLVALGFVAVASAQPPARDSAATTGTGSIRGRITDMSGHPLVRAEVRAGPNAAQVDGRIALTDTEGRYEIKNLPAGTYIIVVAKANFVRTSWGEPRPEGPGKRIPLADGQQVANIDVHVERTGAVAGRIVDEFGDAAAEVLVQAMRYQYVQGTRRLLPSGHAGRSNDLGEFRLFGLTPGQYIVSATLRDFSANTSDTSDRSGYAPTFYPGTGNPAEAQRLSIAPGQTITGISLPLLPIQTAKISGTVVDVDGRPAANAFVNVMAKSAATVMNMGVPLRDGQFTIGGVPPGDYVVRAINPNGNAAEGAIADVTVSGDVSGLQLVMAKPSTIRGRIVFTASMNGSDPPKPTAYDLGAVREWTLGQQVRNPSKIKDDGTFEISLMTGHVQLRAAPVGPGQGINGPPSNFPPPWRINRILLNGTDVGDSGIDVPVNATVDDVIVEMTNHGSDASGAITDADGKIVRDAFVIVFAQDPARWTVQTRWLAVTRPSLDDKFHVRVLAGDYYIVAMSDVETNAWTDVDFLSAARERATKFSIADGETKTIDVMLSPAPVY
jgi:hypothetical protein